MANKRTRVVALVLAAVMTWSPVLRAGDLQSEMNSLFNDMGVSTYTAPGAFRGQAMNTYTGGSLDVRIPNKRYQVLGFEKPSIHAGCNGISINGGSMSLMSGPEFADLLKKFGAAMPALAFQLALSAISPLLSGRVEWMKDLESKLSISSKSSCELASMAWSKIGDAANMNVEKACIEANKILDTLDPEQARKECAKAGGVATAMDRAKNSSDPEVAKLPPFTGNLIWEALKRGNSADLTDDDRELVMSMVGTYIYDETGAFAGSYYGILDKPSQLLKGEDAEDADGKVGVTLLRCDEPVKCLHVRFEKVRVISLTRRVRNYMVSIVEHIRNKQAFAADSEEIAFVNTVGEPVYRMLSIATMTRDDSPAQGLIGRYEDVIAADFAYGLLSRTLRVGLGSLMVHSKLTQAQAEDAKYLATTVNNRLQTLAQEKTAMYTKVSGIESLTRDMERLQTTLRANSASKILTMFGSGYGIAN